MSTLMTIVPDFLKGTPTHLQYRLEQYEFEDWGREGAYLLATVFFAHNICLGFYRCMHCNSSGQELLS